MTTDKTAAIEAVSQSIAHVDVAVLDVPPRDLEVQVITEVDQVIVMPRNHRLGRRRRVRLNVLSKARRRPQ